MGRNLMLMQGGECLGRHVGVSHSGILIAQWCFADEECKVGVAESSLARRNEKV